MTPFATSTSGLVWCPTSAHWRWWAPSISALGILRVDPVTVTRNGNQRTEADLAECCSLRPTPARIARGNDSEGVDFYGANSAPRPAEDSRQVPSPTLSMQSLFAQSEQLPRLSEHWCLTRDGDQYGYELARRHYSARNYREQRQRLFVGPGRKLVLLSTDGLALFVWRRFVDDTQPPQTGHNCALFRNEGQVLSSLLVREAVQVVFDHWGLDRCYTLVNPTKIRSTNAGCCFKCAGWTQCGMSKTGKLIFEFRADSPSLEGRAKTPGTISQPGVKF